MTATSAEGGRHSPAVDYVLDHICGADDRYKHSVLGTLVNGEQVRSVEITTDNTHLLPGELYGEWAAQQKQQ